MFIQVASVFAFAVFANAACTKTYKVVSGDSCLEIPQKNGISSYQLTKLNPSLNCNALSIDQVLCVVDSTYNCQPVYTVKSGDGCWGIANSYGITTEQLLANNPQLGADCPIQPGQNLCVAGGSAVPITSKTTSSAAPTSTVACTKSYKVKSGDNCNDIAVANGVSNYQLTYLNPGLNCNALFIDQSLCLTSATYNCQPTYTVKSGDTCYAIAVVNSITVEKIIENNPNLGSDCNLGVGMNLCIRA